MLTKIRGSKYRCCYCLHNSENNTSAENIPVSYRSPRQNSFLAKKFQDGKFKGFVETFGIGGQPLIPFYPSRVICPAFHILEGITTRVMHIEKFLSDR